MRSTIKRSLAGILIVGALTCSAVGAYAMGGGNGADAFIGIVGGNSGYYLGGGSYNNGPFNASHENRDTYRSEHGSHGGNGAYDGYYHGY